MHGTVLCFVFTQQQEDTEDGYEELNDIVQDELTDHKEDIKLPGNQGSAHGNTVDRKTDGTGDKVRRLIPC